MANFDLDKTRELEKLFKIDRGQRDKEWNQKFLNAVVDASLMCGDPQVEVGPDQLPYFHLGMPNGQFDAFSISHILDTVLEQGFGICVFSDMQNKSMPEFVFSYGDLLSYKLYGTFEGDPNETTGPSATGLIEEVVGAAREIMVGQPSEEYFPGVARKALGNFMKQRMNFQDPKLCLIYDKELQPARNLAINVSLEDVGGSREELQNVFYYLGWFLPRNYGLMSAPSNIDPVALESLV